MTRAISHTRVRLKYRAHVEMGQSPPSSEYSLSPDEGLPFLQGTADFGSSHPVPRVYCGTPTKVAVDGDILFSVRAPVGELNVADQEAGIGRGLCAIRAGTSWIPRFGWWALHEARHQLNYVSTGSTYEAVATEDVANIPVQHAPLEDQRAIADYLDRETARLDALVTAKERVLGLLAEKRRALITRAVTRGLDPRAPLRDSGIPWLGEIPAHWHVVHLKRVLANMDYGISESVDVAGSIAVLRMGDLRNGEIDYTTIGFIDDVDETLLLHPDDLIFNRTNSLDQIGKVAIFRGNLEYPVTLASYLVRLRCNAKAIPEFLNLLLNSSYVVAWARSQALPAIGQVNLNPNRYAYLPVALPPVGEQQTIATHVTTETAKLDALRAATGRTIALLKERRAALIATAVTGRINPSEVTTNARQE